MSMLTANSRMRSGILAVIVVNACMMMSAVAAPSQAPAAPKPARLHDGKPNWTGFWTPLGGLMDRDLTASGPPPGFTPPKDGGAPQMPVPPHADIKSPYKEQYAAGMAAARQGKILYDPSALCLPPGMPAMMDGLYGLEILQTAGQITITSEWAAESRRIWTDGRPHPNFEEVLPTYAGHSTGHWEGDVLVAETVGMRDDARIDQSGLPRTENMRIVERFRSPQPGILEDEITIHDPAVYEKNWSMTKRYRYRPDLNLEEYVCQENNRNVGANGEPIFDIPSHDKR